jgi:hypothetical protein
LRKGNQIGGAKVVIYVNERLKNKISAQNRVFCATKPTIITKHWRTKEAIKSGDCHRIPQKMMGVITTKNPIFAFWKNKRKLCQKTN